MNSKYLAATPDVSRLETDGYLIVGLTDEVIRCIANIFEVGHCFYNQDRTTKAVNSVPRLHEGWQDIGGEFSITPDRPDLSESFWVSRLHERATAAAYVGEAAELRRHMLSCIGMLSDVERGITRQLMVHFGCKESEAPSFNCDQDSDMQLLYYQPGAQTRDTLQDPHDDSLYLTFAKANNPGLELLLSDNQYQRVKLAPNEILLMPGEILSLISGGRIRPLIHKVVRHADQKERISLGYFTFPNIVRGSRVEPWISNEVNRNVDIMERVIHNKNQFLVD